MADLQLREKEIFETLKRLKNLKFVVIGGYAVNAYTLPRFSTDCDIVVRNNEELEEIVKELLNFGYSESKNTTEVPYGGQFKRYEKEITNNFSVSIDILIKKILDRQTGSTFLAEWVFENSSLKILKGKTITEEVKLRIINLDALFVMKFLSCRSTDIRDIFLLVSDIKDKKWIKEEITQRYSFENRLKKIDAETTSNQFIDGLQGVFGKIDSRAFEKNVKIMSDLKNI